MNDIQKIIQTLKDSNILLKEVNKTIINKTKEQKGGFLSMSLGTLGATLLGNLLTGKGIVRAGSDGNKNTIDTLISQPLIDMDISHEKFVTILNEKDKYERMKDNLLSENEQYMSNDISWKQCIKLWDWKRH